jgi:hypothetical protein
MESGVGGRLKVCSELESVWSEAVMVQYTRICIGGNEVNNKATQSEISNVKQECCLLRPFLEIVHVFQLIKRVS